MDWPVRQDEAKMPEGAYLVVLLASRCSSMGMLGGACLLGRWRLRVVVGPRGAGSGRMRVGGEEGQGRAIEPRGDARRA